MLSLESMIIRRVNDYQILSDNETTSAYINNHKGHVIVTLNMAP